MRLFTSHWRSSLLQDVDAVIVGVSRGTPRRAPGYRYRLLRSVAPNDEAWAQKDRAGFEAAYLSQLEALGIQRILADIRRISEQHGGRPLCLLCWERAGDDYCHRWQLSTWLHEQTGIVVPELTAGMLPKRPDNPQLALFDERGGA